MKTKAILSLVSLALFAAVGQSFARGGGGGGFGGGGHFGGGGFGGGHFGTGGFGGGHFGGGGGFGGGHFGGGGFHGSGFNGGGHVVTGVGTRGGGVGFGGMRSRNGVANFEGTGPRFSSFGHPSHAQPQPNGSRAQASRGLVARQPDQRVSNIRNHIVARHDANWHSDWDRRHAHFDHGRFFVFIDGFWSGLDSGFFPWDYFPYYAYDYYPYDYYPGYYDDVEPYYDNEGVADYVPTPDPNVVAVQQDLANLGYYHGSIDGIYGRNTRDAVGRYQTDYNLSVTGTLTTQTLQALGVSQSTPS